MSHNKSWTFRTALTLGATALVLCVSNTSSLAAGHEGRGGGHMIGQRGGGGAGEVRSVNERFGAMRVETLSPATFMGGGHGMPATPAINHPATSTGHVVLSPTGPRKSTEPPVPPPVTPATAAPTAPDTTTNHVVLSPTGPRKSVEPPVPPPVTPSTETDMTQVPTADVQRPSVAGAPRVRDPINPTPDVGRVSTVQPTVDRSGPSADVRRPTSAMAPRVRDPINPTPDVRRVSIVEPTVDQTQPSTDVRRPTLDASPAAQDPVRPRLYTKPAMTPEANTDNVILEEPWRQ